MKRRSTVFTLCLCMAVALLVVQVNSKQRDGHDPAPSLRTSDFQSRDRVRPSNSSSRLKGKKRSSRPIVNAYQDWENVVTRSEVTWNDFVTFAPQPPRQKIYIKPSVLNSIIQCPSESTLNASKVCNLWGDQFVVAWKGRKVKDLCEDNANSKMNFRKVRKRKQEGALTRSWERGFLSADCGDMAKDDIGYLPLYKPDIEGQGDAVCDYVFNETVVAYSHENIRNFGQMVTDYMNVWSMMWLSGVSQQSKDISFLNIDAIKKGKYFGDLPNQFFKSYEVSFRRILRAADFAESNAKVCFKRLILQPRPLLHFQSEGTTSGSAVATTVMDEETAAQCSVSALFQRFNLQIRHNYGLLSAEDAVATLPTNNQIRILLITRSIVDPNSIGAAGAAALPAAGDAPPVDPIAAGSASAHLTSRVFLNTPNIVASLEALVASMQAAGNLVPMEVITSDLAQLPFEEQVRLINSVSLVVGMHGAGIAGSMHMAVGSKYCCGVVEIFPQSGSRSGGYGYLARRMGHHYSRLDLGGEATKTEGSLVPTAALSGVVEAVLKKIIKKGSCFQPSVISAPYL